MEHSNGLLIVILVVAFLPAIVASWRGHRNALAIGALNILSVIFVFFIFLLGAVPWCIALVWACTSNVETKSTVWFKIAQRGDPEAVSIKPQARVDVPREQ